MALRNTYTSRSHKRQQAHSDAGNERSYQQHRYNNYNDNEDEQRLTNIYGGDTSNYGNANQGGFDREWWERMRNKVAGWFGSDKETYRSTPGKYSGIGPKNYKRNEQRIYEDVCELLMDNDGVDAREIDVRVEGNYVVLSGTVHTRTEKRHAEDLALSIPGVWDVENRIRVSNTNYLHS